MGLLPSATRTVVVTNLLAVAACAGSGSGPLYGTMDDGATRCSPTWTLEPGDPNGHPEPLALDGPVARAGRLAANHVPFDANGLAVFQAGDFVLANSHLAVVIEDARPSELYDPYGGKIIGVARVQDGALVDVANYNEVIAGVGRFTFEPESVTVVADGSDGGAAVVRAIGELSIIPFIDDLARVFAPDDFSGIRVAVDYTLEPSSREVEVEYSFSNETPNELSYLQHFVVMQASRMGGFVATHGFDVERAESLDWFGYVDDQAMSYALVWDVPASLVVEVSGTSVFQMRERRTVPACALARQRQFRMRVGGPGLDGLVEATAESERVALREITGQVREADGSSASGVRVHAELADGSGYLTRASVREDGSFSLHVPATAGVRLTAYRVGSELVGPLELEPGATTAMLTMNADGFIEVEATEDDQPVPVRIQLWRVDQDLVAPPKSFGEAAFHYGRRFEFPLDGRARVRVPAGEHRVVVSRGYEYELGADETVQVAAGETAMVTAELQRVVDTSGVLCGDFHIHTHRSPDSPDDPELKLRSALADGLELPARSDHEFIAEFDSLLLEMGAEQWAYGITSLELTTFAWGHFGVFPLTVDSMQPNGGAPVWVGQSPPQVFASVRARSTSPSVIINHPRSASIGGYFSAVGYDPVTGTVQNPDWWDEDFRLMEAFNDSSFRQNFDETVRDWFSFLNSGRPMFAVGSSDSHGVLKGSPVGYPRTCIQMGTDDVGQVRQWGSGRVNETMRRGEFTVSGGVFVDAIARGGVGPGGRVSDASDVEVVTVRVQAASWIGVEALEVYVDGEMVGEVPISGSDVVRYAEDLPIDVAPTGSWVLFHARGESELDPVHPGREAFGVTNPIFFDR